MTPECAPHDDSLAHSPPLRPNFPHRLDGNIDTLSSPRPKHGTTPAWIDKNRLSPLYRYPSGDFLKASPHTIPPLRSNSAEFFVPKLQTATAFGRLISLPHRRGSTALFHKKLSPLRDNPALFHPTPPYRNGADTGKTFSRHRQASTGKLMKTSHFPLPTAPAHPPRS